MWRLRERIRRCAPTDDSVLIVGETGTGKELVARALHEAGKAPRGPFVPIMVPPRSRGDGGAGAVRGHTRRVQRRRGPPGAFREAERGTLFLDEIGELSPAVQAKLLRALEAREGRAVGGTGAYAIGARVVAATNRDVRRKDSGFRQDLYERFDLDLLGRRRCVSGRRTFPSSCRTCSKRFGEKRGQPVPESAPFIEAARGLTFTGNVRALRRFLKSALDGDGDPGSMMDDAQIADPATITLASLLSPSVEAARGALASALCRQVD